MLFFGSDSVFVEGAGVTFVGESAETGVWASDLFKEGFLSSLEDTFMSSSFAPVAVLMESVDVGKE